ncbi:ParB/RepB/Spo0J family partition protein [Aneurinibacillus terranovensis]|uniref:ParB/RepB/Spo0J family partition protein n=1 Tax=Aneurinibacillus terranovensis TaxID=278991 RepID=UPI0003F8A13C|nr:ParB/RepB/Spo0J family partition protein [Aneurinibacillus terranovensis]
MNKRLGRGLDALFSINVDEQDQIIEISIKEIRPNPYQPRKVFEEQALNELTESIKEHGIIQPLVARKSVKGYELVAGERRLRAAQLADLDKVPIVIKNFTDQQVMEIALIENLQRENLNTMEIAQAYQKLMNAFSLTQEELAKKVGKSRPHVANFLRLLQLPDEIQKQVSKGTLSMGHARALLAVEDDTRKVELAKEVEKKILSVRQLEEIIKKLDQRKDVSRETKPVKKTSYIADFEERMRMKFGTSVNIKPVKNKEKGKIEIVYFSQEDLERIIDIIESK